MGLQRRKSNECDLAGDKVIDGQLVEWIRSGIERDERYTPEDIICGIRNGNFQLFRYPKGIVITQITDHQRLLVFLISGDDFDSWKEEANLDLIAYSKALGISVVEAYCRRGLEKSLKEIGWRTEQIVMRYRITES